MIRSKIFQDWDVNNGEKRIQITLASFRLAQQVTRLRSKYAICRLLLLPYLAFYKMWAVWIFHMELRSSLEVGSNLRIFHGFCLVIHPQTRIGNNVTLRHGVTLGNKVGSPGAPILEDGVDVGAHAQMIGSITIGKQAIIGAGAVVTKDVPPGAVVVGNPARIIRQNPIV